MKLGYVRISTSGQDASMQVEALINAGVDPQRIFTDELSGAKEAKERPGMKALMDYAARKTTSTSGGWTGSAGR
jgi:DNA invertase Pin-like site-specific DNA recombinase